MSRLAVRGFTLMELLIVAAIVALLGALAYPGYQRHLAASRRVMASACLIGQAQMMERHYAAQQSYQNAGYQDAPEPVPCHEVMGFYQFAFAAAPTADSYVLQAEPQGAQALHDAGCGTLWLNQRGERMVSTEREPERCW